MEYINIINIKIKSLELVDITGGTTSQNDAIVKEDGVITEFGVRWNQCMDEINGMVNSGSDIKRDDMVSLIKKHQLLGLDVDYNGIIF